MASNIKTYGISTKPIEVPQALQDGEKFIKWDEDSPAVGVPVTLRVDPKGFFLYWTDQNMEVEMLDIATIRDVRTGNYAKVPKDAKLRGVLSIGAGDLEEKTISVCHGGDFVNVSFVNFCCAKKEVAVMWMESLFTMAYNIHTANLTAMRVLEKVHTKIVLRADKTGKIAIKNIIRALTASKEERRRVEKALSEAGLPAGKLDMVAATKFTFDDFFAFYKCLMQRTEIQELFDQLSEGKAWIGAGALAAFLNGPQRDPRLNEILHPYADLPRAKDLIRQHEPNKYHRARDQLSSDGFLRLLMCEESGLVARWRLEPLEDMEQPLAHYFINSSHNTYLTGHQLTGRSSVEIYRQALLAGCRCVELDFWNSRTEEPVIVHGYTFVPEVPARDVLEAIAESAFKTSPFPVVLSFENHCNPRQQAKIAAYCREIFKDMLLEEPLKTHPLRAGGVLPSPAQLKHKIIIKNKKQHHHHKHSGPPSPSSGAANGDLQEDAEEERLEEEGSAQGSVESSSTSGSSSSETSGSESEGEGEGVEGKGERKAKGEVHAGSELSALVNYVQPVHFTTFENAEKKNRFYEMSSFDEKAAMNLLKERPVEFVNYNKTQLSRVYPAGTRFDSSNFMPQVFWNAGCQLVALNYQTLDLPMQLNVAAFEYNGRSGYLLKPDIMRRPDRKLDLFAENTVDGIVAGSLSVRVVSAQFASEKKVGLYVEVDLLGLPGDTVRKRYRTRVSTNSPLGPRFDEAAFPFPRVVAPELAWLRVALLEEGGKLVGHRVAPLTAIRPGWRHVVLRSELGAPVSATLLLQLSVADYVPDALADLADALANPIRYQSELERRAQTLAALYDEHQPTEDDTKVAEQTKAGSVSVSPAAAAAAAVSGRANSTDIAPAYNSSSGITTSVPAPNNDADGGGSDSEASNCSEGTVSARAEAEVALVLSCRAARNMRAALARKVARLHAPRARRLPRLPAALKRTLSALTVTRHAQHNHAPGNATREGGSGTSPSGSSAPASSSASNSAESAREAERALRLRYHTTIYAALERHARHLEEQQMKQLTVELESERKGVLTRLAATRRDEVRQAARGGPEARRRAQRDAHQASVERGVQQMEKLERRYARRRLALAAAHARANATIEALREQELLELEKLCGESSGSGG